MPLGNDIQQYTINGKASQTAIQLREAFENVQIMAGWLNLHPKVEGEDDPLLAYNFTPEECVILREVYEAFEAKRIELAPVFAEAQRITGLD